MKTYQATCFPARSGFSPFARSDTISVPLLPPHRVVFAVSGPFLIRI